MCDVYRSLGNSLDLVEVLSTFDRELRKLIGYDSISVHLVDNTRLTPAYAAGEDIANQLASPQDLDSLLQVLAERQPLVTEFSLVFPLENVNKAIAILALYRDHPQPPFSEDHLELLGLLSVKLAVSIENAQKFQLAAESLAVDPATGLANGRSLFERLDAELARARRAKTRLAVLQCCVAGLAESSRLCSPESGRRAFEQVAARIRETCREYDFSARTGDDMLLILPGFGPSDFEEKRELIEKLVEETSFAAGLPLFAIVGAAFYPEDGHDTEDLLAESARRLNVAKRIDCGGEHVDGRP